MLVFHAAALRQNPLTIRTRASIMVRRQFRILLFSTPQNRHPEISRLYTPTSYISVPDRQTLLHRVRHNRR
jgi:hypothetical protein